MTVRETGEYFEITTGVNARWDLLAYEYYGDVRLQSLIINANFHLYADNLVRPPLIIPVGTTLRIPVIEDDGIDETDLPPWKRNNPDYSITP